MQNRHIEAEAYWEPGRRAAGLRRSRPAAGALRIRAEGPAPAWPQTPPCELILEATMPDGTPSGWLRWELLEEMAAAWGEHPLSLRLAATPKVASNDVVWSLVRWARERWPAWRWTLESDGRDLCGMADVHRILTSPFHEVCFRLDFLPPAEQDRGGEALAAQQVYLAIRDLIELRNSRRQAEPKITWIYLHDAADADAAQRAERLARQLCFDGHALAVGAG